MSVNIVSINDEPLVSGSAVRKKLGIGISGFQALIRQGLPRYALNQRVHRFRWSEIEVWLAVRRRGDD